MSISKQELELADLQGSIDRISARQDIQEEKIHDCLIGIKNLIIVVEDMMRQSKQLADENSAICKRLDRIEQRLSDIDDKNTPSEAPIDHSVLRHTVAGVISQLDILDDRLTRLELNSEEHNS